MTKSLTHQLSLLKMIGVFAFAALSITDLANRLSTIALPFRVRIVAELHVPRYSLDISSFYTVYTQPKLAVFLL